MARDTGHCLLKVAAYTLASIASTDTPLKGLICLNADALCLLQDWIDVTG
jgi:hypothetical protein